MTRALRHRSLLPVALLSLLLAACGGGDADDGASAGTDGSGGASAPADSGDGGGGGTVITIADFAFEPAELTVAAGETITVVNEDSARHTVTVGTNGQAAADAPVDEEVDAGSEIEVTFDEPGTYDITCRLHPTMTMTVTVDG